MRHILAFVMVMGTSLHAADPVAEIYLRQASLVEDDVLSVARASTITRRCWDRRA